MKPKIALIIIFMLYFLFLGCTEHQKARHKDREIELFEVGIKKDTLYFIWEDSNNYLKPYYSDRENALVFICCNGEVFLFEDGSVFETLNIKNLNNYKISSLNNLYSINKEWHKKIQLLLHKNTMMRVNLYLLFLTKCLAMLFI